MLKCHDLGPKVKNEGLRMPNHIASHRGKSFYGGTGFHDFRAENNATLCTWRIVPLPRWRCYWPHPHLTAVFFARWEVCIIKVCNSICGRSGFRDFESMFFLNICESKPQVLQYPLSTTWDGQHKVLKCTISKFLWSHYDLYFGLITLHNVTGAPNNKRCLSPPLPPPLDGKPRLHYH